LPNLISAQVVQTCDVLNANQIVSGIVKGNLMMWIDPDAHSIHEIDNIRWGVCAARKGGLTKRMTWNAMPLKKVESWLRRKNLQG
jgi:histidinol phosphatase-like PHP family hydrolase